MRIPTGRRSLDAYLLLPEAAHGRLPAVVVLHEIFGPDAHIRDMTRRISRLGHVAVAPGLFPPEVQSVMTPENFHGAMASFAGAPPDLRSHPDKRIAFAASQPPVLRPVLSALADVQNPTVQSGYADDLAGVTGFFRQQERVAPDRIAAVGFCFGGTMAGLLATVDPRLRAAILFYGHNPRSDRIPAIRAHLLGFYGGEDLGITNTVPELAEAMRASGKSFASHIYPGAKHAFFNDTRAAHYHPESARDAWDRVQQFLRAEFAAITEGASPS